VNRRPLVALALSLAVVALARADENPLAKAKAGEWVIQKNVVAGMRPFGTFTFIAKVDGKKVTVASQPLAEDMKTATAAAQTRDPVESDKALPASKDDKRLADEEIEAKGKKLKCKKTESIVETKDGKFVTTTWTSSEVPVYGIVRQVVKDKDGQEVLRSDLVDWGAEGGKEKPLPEKK
jgi:hypothetical protein